MHSVSKMWIFAQWLNHWMQKTVAHSAAGNTVKPTPLKSALPGDWTPRPLRFPKIFGVVFNRSLSLLLSRYVSLEKAACQGSCQHTSCSSCLLLKVPSCPQTCSPSDSSCLQRFGKCVHRHLADTHNPVCHSLQVGRTTQVLCLFPVTHC